MSILYPNTITIKRPVTTVQGGPVGYQGETEAQETILVSGIPANVVPGSPGLGRPVNTLPDDAPRTSWIITVPYPGAATLPTIMEEDRVYDDIGRRFMVSAFQPTNVGVMIHTLRLKT